MFENEGFWARLGTPEHEAHHIFPQLSRALFEDPIVHIIEQDFVLLLVMVYYKRNEEGRCLTCFHFVPPTQTATQAM